MNDGNTKTSSDTLVIQDSTMLFNEVCTIIEQARGHIQQVVNHSMAQAYWLIGKTIIEHEQQGQQRAAYGKQWLKHLSQQLTQKLGKGFDTSNLRNMRRFYIEFPIQDAVRPELSWTIKEARGAL